MAVQIQYLTFKTGEGDDVQFAQIHAAFLVVVRFFAQRRRQSQQKFVSRNPLGLGFAAHQLAERKSAATSLQLIAPFVVEPASLVEHEEHLEIGIAKQHVRRLAGRREFVGTVGDVQALQQALADPTLTLPFAGIGQKGVGLLGRDGQQA